MAKKTGHGMCDICGAKCCRYVTVEIDKPRDKTDREEIRWFLAHENVHVYIDDDDGTWNVQFFTPCGHLDGDNRCRIYDRRYEVCRDYDTEDCEASDGEPLDRVFRTPDDFDVWWDEKKRKKKRKKDRKRKK